MRFFKQIKLNVYAIFSFIWIFQGTVSCVLGEKMLKSDKMKNNSYVLATGKKGAKALDIQQEYIAQGSYKHLQKAGLKPGMIVYDVGCGSGVMTAYLAKQVGSKGHVFAIDISAEQLSVAKQKVKDAGLDNVTFVQADVQELGQLPGDMADIIYFRYLLVHLTAPKIALENMYQHLKVGGKLAFQEPTWHTIHTNYPKDFLVQYRDAVIKLGERKGVNYNVGRSSPKMACQLPGSEVDSYELENKVSLGQYKELAYLRLSEMGDKLMSAGLVTEEDLLNWKKEIASMPADDSRYFVNLGNLTCVLVEKKDN